MTKAAGGPMLVDDARAMTLKGLASGQSEHPGRTTKTGDSALDFGRATAEGRRDGLLVAIIEQLPLAVYTTDAEGRVTYFNPAAAALAGREPVLGEDRWCVTGRLVGADGAAVAREDFPMAVALRERRPIRGVEALAERPDGTRVPFAPFPTPIFGGDGQLVGGFNLLVDLSERKQAEQTIAHLAQHDQLTGLPNRRMLGVQLAQRMAQARQLGEELVVMRIDLDQLETFNNEHGGAIGDEILIEASRRLRAVIGDGFLARIGGDKFKLVSAPMRTEDTSWPLAERVLAAFSQPFQLDGLSLPVTISVGCSRFPHDGDDETRIVAAANAALHLAKGEGGNCLRMFDISEQARQMERASLRRALRSAIEAGEIVLHYQPLFRADGSVASFEALARWTDRERGVVSPEIFIPLAEQSGLIAALGSHVLRSACREAASWAQPLRVAVNLSSIEFQSETLPQLVEAVLTETGLDPERLELEITEGVMVTDTDRAMLTIAKLRALGVRVALDDFGTGYSSLSYLHRFPLTTLKIDRSFVATLGTTPESVPITRAIIQLGHALGIEVVAEGVETPEQLDFLIQERCDMTQGYLLGRPMEPRAYAHITGAAMKRTA